MSPGQQHTNKGQEKFYFISFRAWFRVSFFIQGHLGSKKNFSLYLPSPASEVQWIHYQLS